MEDGEERLLVKKKKETNLTFRIKRVTISRR